LGRADFPIWMEFEEKSGSELVAEGIKSESRTRCETMLNLKDL